MPVFHLGIEAARARLGDLADRARDADLTDTPFDGITYLTRHGTVVAAVVPASTTATVFRRRAAKTVDELAASVTPDDLNRAAIDATNDRVFRQRVATHLAEYEPIDAYEVAIYVAAQRDFAAEAVYRAAAHGLNDPSSNKPLDERLARSWASYLEWVATKVARTAAGKHGTPEWATAAAMGWAEATGTA